MERLRPVVSVEPSILEIPAATLVWESSLLIRIRAARVELRRRLAVELPRWHRRHSMHHRCRRAGDVVHRRLPAFHRQRVQLHRRRDVAGVVLAAHLDALQLPVGLQRRMLVSCFQNSIFGGRVLRLLDAQTFGRVLFVAQLEDHREALFVRRALLADQPVLVLYLVKARQLVHQAHRSFLLRVRERLDAFLGVFTARQVAQDDRSSHCRRIFLVRAHDRRL